MGAAKPSADDLDRAMGFILAVVADGHVGVDQARRLIRNKGVVAAAKQMRKATRDVRRQASIAGRTDKRAEHPRPPEGKKKRK